MFIFLLLIISSITAGFVTELLFPGWTFYQMTRTEKGPTPYWSSFAWPWFLLFKMLPSNRAAFDEHFKRRKGVIT